MILWIVLVNTARRNLSFTLVISLCFVCLDAVSCWIGLSIPVLSRRTSAPLTETIYAASTAVAFIVVFVSCLLRNVTFPKSVRQA